MVSPQTPRPWGDRAVVADEHGATTPPVPEVPETLRTVFGIALTEVDRQEITARAEEIAAR
ncbi:hypothetical protein J4H86_18750 [Spiractinospora alimapuensis]|uniref:hypothetical protein n=1 Tax=Spiractinospora alimapuensis TaxID=2820884 RepID=UPI001F4702D1|nr:hypothetical protein [Spiractinospora alimapuensis]QVQ50885.1 hypothetical protein J4H86_18750 [Spiractinospora alimapuensis]